MHCEPVDRGARHTETIGSVKATTVEQPQSLVTRDRHPALRVTVVLTSAIAVICFAFFVRIIPYGRAYWDFMFIMQGAYRVRIGEVPHVDFISPVGPLVLYLTYLAGQFFLAGQPFIGLHALMWLLLVPATALLAGRLATGAQFCAALLLLGLMVLVPYQSMIQAYRQ